MNLFKASIATAAVITCCLGNEMPAKASSDLFKAKWVDTTMDCISYASKVNCDKAYSAANAYERSLSSNPDAKYCALMASSTGAMASATSLTGGKSTLQEGFEGALRVCKKF